MKPKFTPFRTSYEFLGKPGESEQDFYRDYLDGLRSFQSPQHFRASVNTTSCERTWVEDGKPYYKVWPNMCDAMLQTSINIDAAHLKAPFRTFAVLPPNGADVGSSALFALFRPGEENVVVDKAAKLDPPDAYLLMMRYYSQDEGKKAGETLLLHLHYGRTIDEALRKSLAAKSVDNFTKMPTGGEPIASAMMRVAICVMFFATENHEVIMPDIKREHITIKGRGKGAKVARKLAEKRELAKCKGWKVGSEIDLPRPLVTRLKACRHGAGQELQYGHIRSGHMRMQPCGRNNQDRKLIFVAPTVVRPDLPVRTTHGYRIPDRILG